jgi:hypothetical protein
LKTTNSLRRVFTEAKTTDSGDATVNTSQYWINKAFPGDQSNLFMVGHTQEKLDMLLGKNTTIGDGSQMALLQYWAHPSSGSDYNTANFNRSKIPEMIATSIGVSFFHRLNMLIRNTGINYINNINSDNENFFYLFTDDCIFYFLQ